VHSSY